MEEDSELPFDAWRPLRPTVQPKKNMWRFVDDTKAVIEMQLTRGAITRFDACMLDKISAHSWCVWVDPKYGHKYAVTGIRSGARRTCLRMHRLLCGTSATMVTDHIDGDTLHNCNTNLRECSQRVNMNNQRKNRTNTSGVHGVHHSEVRSRYQAYWNTASGKTARKGFSYGPKSLLTREEAFEKAEALRKEMDALTGCLNGIRAARS
jgi:hypothetical protein